MLRSKGSSFIAFLISQKDTLKRFKKIKINGAVMTSTEMDEVMIRGLKVYPEYLNLIRIEYEFNTKF